MAERQRKLTSETQSVHAATRRTLLKIKGFSEVKVEKVKEAISKCLVSATAIHKRVVRIE